jgi:hypothetical protein
LETALAVAKAAVPTRDTEARKAAVSPIEDGHPLVPDVEKSPVPKKPESARSSPVPAPPEAVRSPELEKEDDRLHRIEPPKVCVCPNDHDTPGSPVTSVAFVGEKLPVRMKNGKILFKVNDNGIKCQCLLRVFSAPLRTFA